MLQSVSGSKNLWWQTLLAAVVLAYGTVSYYWVTQGSVTGGLGVAVQQYVSNWPVVSIFFLLAATSLWLKLRQLPGEERARMEALNSTGMLSFLLGSCGLLLALGVLAWQVSWASLRAMVEALAYPPVFVTGSTSLVVAGLALAFASWPASRRAVLLRASGRVGLTALLGFLPLLVWWEVEAMHLQLQTAAAMGLLIFAISLLLLLSRPKRLWAEKSGREDKEIASKGR